MNTENIKSGSQLATIIMIAGLLWLGHHRLKDLETIARAHEKALAEMQLRAVIREQDGNLFPSNVLIWSTNYWVQTNLEGKVRSGYDYELHVYPVPDFIPTNLFPSTAPTNILEITPTNWLSQSNYAFSPGVLTNGWESIVGLVNTNPPGWVYGMARNNSVDDGTNIVWDKVLISTNGGKDIIFKGEYQTIDAFEAEHKRRWEKIMQDLADKMREEIRKLLHPVPDKTALVI